MDHSPCLAHLTDDGRTQTVLTHLLGTASLARAFAQPFGGESQAELAGLSHDIGKYSAAFQRRLHGGPRTDHATAGAAECWQRRQPFAAFAVAGHHGGLPDGGGQGDGPELATLCGRIKRKERNLLEPYDSWRQEVQLPQADIPSFVQHGMPEGMFFTRMLYSCLVDADSLHIGLVSSKG